ncbi:Uma2 family endonuclease [Spirosoma sp. BT702]|uniref:Uma2 family endonuclease n=1 Tax=Spirosoma profusum TaxID=2771354 RepID=A0A926Y512_9BACT|nr:Uma2 family endonuclease [Spirosoma profusum]MBD2704030.1 Uma2 family endonuclease [Spirosoma profusum]
MDTTIRSSAQRKSRSAPQTVTEFEKWISRRKTDANYEFVRGRIIRKPPMKQEELFIARFLMRAFAKTQLYKQGAEMLSEGDAYVDTFRKRIPDLAVFTDEQIREAKNGKRFMPPLAIEILSDSESQNDVLDKVQDYFDAGVQLVWYIAPKQQKIFSYTSPDDIKVFKGQDVCSASPVAPDFSFTINDLFNA